MICDGACDDDEAILLRAGAIAFCMRLEWERRGENKMLCYYRITSFIRLVHYLHYMCYAIYTANILKLVSWALNVQLFVSVLQN